MDMQSNYVVIQTLTNGDSEVYQAGRYFDRVVRTPTAGAINTNGRSTTLHVCRLCWSHRFKTQFSRS